MLQSLIDERPPGVRHRARIVQDGTLPVAAHHHRHPRASSPQRVAAEPLRGASIVVIGKVAGLREHLRWFDARPLFGKRIVVTRAREQAIELVERLEELGAQTIEARGGSHRAVADTSALDEACATASNFDWIVFTSQNAVEHFMRRAARRPRRRALAQGTAHLRRRTGDGGDAWRATASRST